jgi:glucose-1-phosphate adenylyltransferase
MGIYVFDADLLVSELVRDAADPTSSHDFGKDIIPSLLAAAPRVRPQLQRQLRQHGGHHPVLA